MRWFGLAAVGWLALGGGCDWQDPRGEHEENIRQARARRVKREKARYKRLETLRRDRESDAGPPRVVVIPFEVPDAGVAADARVGPDSGSDTSRGAAPEPPWAMPALEPFDGKPDTSQPSGADFQLWRGRPTSVRDSLGPVVNASNAFAMDLFHRLIGPEENGGFAPVPLFVSLALLSGGAMGHTQSELRRALHLSFDDTTLERGLSALRQELAPALATARILRASGSVLWLAKEIPEPKTLKDRFRNHPEMGVRHVDFAGGTEAARSLIQQWVEGQRKGTKALVDPGQVSGGTRGLFTAVQDLGDPLGKNFHRSQTRPGRFYLQACRLAQLPIMRSGVLPGSYTRDGEWSILDVPLPGGLAVMFLWPQWADNLSGMRRTITTNKLRWWSNMLRKQKVSLLIPGFEASLRVPLAPALARLGVGSITRKDASLGGVAPELGPLQGLWLASHMNLSEAAPYPPAPPAKRWSRITGSYLPAYYSSAIAVDRPFLIIVRHPPTGALLWIGQVANPMPGARTEEHPCPYSRQNAELPPSDREKADPDAWMDDLFPDHSLMALGGIDRETLQSLIKGHRKALLDCLNAGWKAQEKLMVLPTLAFTIQIDGRVTDVAASFKGRPHKGTTACLEREAKKWSFSVKSREPTLVRITLPSEMQYRNRLLYRKSHPYGPNWRRRR